MARATGAGSNHKPVTVRGGRVTPLYYCFLNIAKTLLTVRSATFSARHGLSPTQSGNRIALKNEVIHFKTGGVFPAFSRQFGSPILKEEVHTLQSVLYNLPYVHRAYSLTYSNTTERFFPLTYVALMRDELSRRARLQADVPARYNSGHFIKSLPSGWEKTPSNGPDVTMRRKKGIKWLGNDVDGSLDRLANYNRSARKDLDIVYAPQNRWYLRKNVSSDDSMPHPSPVLTLAAMHTLSELCRYDPKRMKRHFDARHNFLLAEFVRQAPAQYLHAVACEISGREFLRPDSYGSESA